MKKNTTPISGLSAETRAGGCRAAAPRKSTVAFLRQFARAYMPVKGSPLPGFVLN